MKRNLTTALFVATTIILSQSSCSDETEPDASGRAGAARTSASCGQYYNQRHTELNGYYIYPAQTLNFSGLCNGAKVYVDYIPEDVPNRFIIRDNNNNIVSQSGQSSGHSGHNGWIGATNYPGEWGQNGFTTPGSETQLEFIYDSSKTYTLTVETITTDRTDLGSLGSGTDSWSVSLNCALPQ